MSALGVLVAHNTNWMYFFLDMKKQTYAFARTEKDPEFLRIKFDKIFDYHVLDLEVSKDQTVGKIRVAVVNVPNGSWQPEIWLLEVSVNGS